MRRFWAWLPWVLLLLLSMVYFGKINLSHLPFSSSTQPQQQSSTAIKPEVARSLPSTSSGSTGVVSYSSAVKLAAPAVVNIFTTQKIEIPAAQQQLMNDPFFRHFFGDRSPSPRENNATSLGSGVIVSQDGYILTNNHVVAKADKIVVALNDGRRANAKVIGTDPDSDLAVIQILLKDLPVLPFENHENMVGDVVLAIGNPFGVGQTVTQGIISATGRSGLGINAFEDFIQTDAAINPGNSGGALIDVAGNLVGINSAIYSKSGGNMGIGFAIPASLAETVMNSIIKDGKVIRGWLGVEVKGADEIASEFTSDKDKINGVLVMGVVNNGPADKGGLRPNDIIRTINGQTITTANQLITLISKQKPNSNIDVLVLRKNEEVKLSVAVGERPKQSDKNGNDEQQQNQQEQGQSGIERFLFGDR